MEITKEDFKKMGYNTTIKKVIIKESWTSKVFRKIQENKFISTVVLAFIMFSILNIAMICSFMKVLQNIWN